MKYVSIDIETTGITPENCQVLEFAAVIEDTSKDIPVDQLPEYHTLFAYNRIEGEPVALKMNSELINRIAKGEGRSWADASLSFGRFLRDHGFTTDASGIFVLNVAGKNFNGFDDRFLQRTPFAYLFRAHRRTIDPAILYTLPTDEILPNLEECKRRAGLDPKVAHTALADARDIVELIRLSGIFNK